VLHTPLPGPHGTRVEIFSQRREQLIEELENHDMEGIQMAETGVFTEQVDALLKQV